MLNNFKIGDRVKHIIDINNFDILSRDKNHGTILSINNTHATIKFDDNSVKEILIDYLIHL